MKVILHKLFPYAPYLNEYIGFEDEVWETETELEAVDRLRKLAERSHKERYPHLYTESGSPVTIEQVPEQQVDKTNEISKEDAVQRVVGQINSCTELKVLQSYRMIAAGNPVLKEAYDNKLKTFE